jgi:CDP-diacylglycerol--serine O-phosphatidyltransferase
MEKKKWRDHLIDPRSPERRPRRAAYALPTLFTAGNVFLGFYSIIEIFQAALLMPAAASSTIPHFRLASIAIGAAVFLDGLDGRIARMTNTVSDFGREMDSLADVITFGIAPAILAFVWGVQFVDAAIDRATLDYLHRAGYFVTFLFLLCGAMRLARFNIQHNPMPSNPGRSDKKYFVGLPIPSAAGMVASVVYAAESEPLHNWIISAAWLCLVALLSFLMVSTWRYPSFKDLNLLQPRSPLIVVLLGSLVYLIVVFSHPVLLGMSAFYVGTGIVIRLGGIVRRRLRQHPSSHPEHQVG